MLVEFSNILATYLRTGTLSRTQAQALMHRAEKSIVGLVSLPHVHALLIAEEFRVSAYDARFLGAAQNLRARLVTEDVRLRAAAAALTMSIADALGTR